MTDEALKVMPWNGFLSPSCQTSSPLIRLKKLIWPAKTPERSSASAESRKRSPMCDHSVAASSEQTHTLYFSKTYPFMFRILDGFPACSRQNQIQFSIPVPIDCHWPCWSIALAQNDIPTWKEDILHHPFPSELYLSPASQPPPTPARRAPVTRWIIRKGDASPTFALSNPSSEPATGRRDRSIVGAWPVKIEL